MSDSDNTLDYAEDRSISERLRCHLTAIDEEVTSIVDLLRTNELPIELTDVDVVAALRVMTTVTSELRRTLANCGD